MAWLATMQAKNFAAAASYFAADGMKFLDRQDPLVGPAAIQAYFEADAAKMPNASMSWTTDNVVVAASGDMAVETGNWVYSNEGKEIDRGKFVTNWRKVEGAWKVSTDIGASTVPAVVDTAAVKKPATN
jgi:ketosteroid isomerase-like protein